MKTRLCVIFERLVKCYFYYFVFIIKYCPHLNTYIKQCMISIKVVFELLVAYAHCVGNS